MNITQKEIHIVKKLTDALVKARFSGEDMNQLLLFCNTVPRKWLPSHVWEEYAYGKRLLHIIATEKINLIKRDLYTNFTEEAPFVNRPRRRIVHNTIGPMQLNKWDPSRVAIRGLPLTRIFKKRCSPDSYKREIKKLQVHCKKEGYQLLPTSILLFLIRNQLLIPKSWWEGDGNIYFPGTVYFNGSKFFIRALQTDPTGTRGYLRFSWHYFYLYDDHSEDEQHRVAVLLPKPGIKTERSERGFSFESVFYLYSMLRKVFYACEIKELAEMDLRQIKALVYGYAKTVSK